MLVLSDSHDETIAAGHKLYPRFLTYVDSNLMEVGAVLEKMFQKYGIREANKKDPLRPSVRSGEVTK